MKTASIIISTLIALATISYIHYQAPQEDLEAQASSRNFVTWMQTVPEDGWGNTGIKALIMSINPGVTTVAAQNMAIDLTEAAKKYPNFCNTGNEEKDKMEFSAFLSIIGAETSFSDNFPCTTEIGCPNCQACSYNSQGEQCQEKPNLQYYGRGPLQLSWNFNYADFSEYYNGDRNIFLNNPELVSSDPVICWSSAIWFWNQKHRYGGWCMPQAAWKQFNTCDAQCGQGPQSCSNPSCSQDHWITPDTASCHDAIHTGDGFGEVMNIINGGYECCPSSTYGHAYTGTLNRQWWYVDIYHKWTGGFQYDNLSNIQSNNCALAKSINCGKMAHGECWSQCCSFN